MSVKVAAALLVIAPLAARAQTPSYIVTRLGNDTVAVERYTRTANKLEGDLVLRYPRVRTIHYVGDLAPDGSIKNLTTTVVRASAGAGSPPTMRMVTTFGDTLAVIETTRNGQRDTTASGRRIYRGRASPFLGTEPAAYGIYEQLLASSKLRSDSVSYVLVAPGSGPSPSIILRRRGADSVSFTSTFFPGWIEVARVDSRGRILGVDATPTTIKTVAQRVPNLDVAALTKSWAAVEASRGGVMGQMSPPDTVRSAVGGANLSVAYSRPLKRGRVIFGNVVPLNQVWRTGANAATEFTTDKDLAFGSTVIPAGKYTLWTVPSANGAQLIFNSETGQWGTDYHADKDFARVNLTQTPASTPVEQFVIGVEPQGSGGVLSFAWDDRRWTAPFTIKQ
ncbi:MAG TPA: DUF2911 domain-containing protein [Gemmatimonadaceae bacterium]|nr:DUF2911 domain-containing protein [Gemmatimonadaceae bacterium]